MTNDKPELSSAELLRQAREAVAPGPETMPPEVPTDETDPPVSPPTAASTIPAPPAAWSPPVSSPPPPMAPGPAPAPVSSPPPGVPGPAPAPVSSPPLPMAPGPAPAPVSSPPPPGVARTPSASSGGIDYYAAEEFKPQSYGSQTSPPPPGGYTGTPAPPPSLGTAQQPRPPMSPAPSRGRNIPWRLVIGIGAVAIFGIIGAIAGRGTTTATSIGVGDCFQDPGLGDFSSVKDQDCAVAHDIQVFARVKNVPAGLIASDSNDPASAGSRCEAELFEVLADDALLDPAIVIPDDAVMTWFGDTDVSRSGDVLCAIESPSGTLVGSVVP